MNSDTLFDLESVKKDSPRLELIKAHDIQTHHAPHMVDAPWMAIPMKLARAALSGYGPADNETSDVPTIMSRYCNVLEYYGLVFEGMTEQDAQDAALQAVLANKPEQTL